MLATFTLVTDPSKILPATGRRESNTPKNDVPAAGAVAKKIWDNQIANKVAWVMALFPSLILYSALAMREPYLIFFLILAIFGIVSWFKTQNYKYFFITIVGFIGTLFFHGAMIVGLLIFLGVITLVNFFKFFKSLKKFKLSITSLALIIFAFLVLGLLSTKKIHISYLNSFERMVDLNVVQHQSKISTQGEASWPEWTIINSPIEILYKTPIRSLYFVLSPFPWDIKKNIHLIGLIDAWLYLYLSILILKNIKHVLRDPILRTILLILIAYLFVFGIGVGNFGTGIRHRSKVVFLFILLAAPYIKNFKFIKKN